MKKNLFLFPALVLTAFLCFITAACSSGYEEKGEVSFTFTGPMINQIMSRGVGSSGLYEGQGSYSGYNYQGASQIENLYAAYAGYTADYEETFTLYVLTDNTYFVVSADLMRDAASKFTDLEEKYKDNPMGMLSDPDYLAFAQNLYEDATVSKGTWSQSGNQISITEKYYYNATSKSLVETKSPSVIAVINASASTFTVSSQAGYTITFSNYNIAQQNDNPYGYDDPYGNDEPYDDPHNQEAVVDVTPKLKVELNVGSKTYEKSVDIVEVEFGALGKEIGENVSDKDMLYVMLAYSDGKYVIQRYKNNQLLAVLSEGTWKEGSSKTEIIVQEKGKTGTQKYNISESEPFEIETNNKLIEFSEEYVTDDFINNYKYLPVTVTFSNLKVGSRAKVSAKVTYGGYTFATGESDSFKIEESSAVNVKMKISAGPSNQGGNNQGGNQGGNDGPVHARYPINFTISGFPEGASINASGSNTLKARMDLYMVNTSSPAASIIQEFIQANSEKVSDETYLKLFDATSTESSETSIGNATNLGTWGMNYNPVTISNGKFTDATSVGSYSFVGASEKKAYIFATILLDDGYYYLALPSAAQEFSTSGNNISLTLKKWKIPYELTVMLGEFDAEYPSEETSDYKAGDSVRFTLDNINNEKEVVADKLADVKEKLSKNGYSYNQYLSGYEYWGATYSSIAYFYKLKKASGSGGENQGSEEENHGGEAAYTEFGGDISFDNDAFIIEIDKTEFTPASKVATFSAKTKDDKFIEDEVRYEFEMYYKGRDVNSAGFEGYSQTADNKLTIDADILPSGQYQLYVKAHKKMKNEYNDLYSSRYFTITVSQ